MEFEPKNPLEASLMKAATEPAHRPQFYRDFVQSEIYFIEHGAAAPTQSEKIVLAENTALQIQNIEFQGKTYIPIFSSIAELEKMTNRQVKYIGINALEFMKVIKGSAMLLNPGSAYAKEFLENEIDSIIDGSIWQPQERYTVEKETKVMIGQPKNYPTELANALSVLYKSKKDVKRAWLAHFFNPSDGLNAHTLVAIEATGGFDEISAESGIVISSLKVPDPPVDIMRVTNAGGINGYFLNEAKPFYKRKIWGLF